MLSCVILSHSAFACVPSPTPCAGLRVPIDDQSVVAGLRYLIADRVKYQGGGVMECD